MFFDNIPDAATHPKPNIPTSNSTLNPKNIKWLLPLDTCYVQTVFNHWLNSIYAMHDLTKSPWSCILGVYALLYAK